MYFLSLTQHTPTTVIRRYYIYFGNSEKNQAIFQQVHMKAHIETQIPWSSGPSSIHGSHVFLEPSFLDSAMRISVYGRLL